jgi:hypothetical protein
MQKEGSLEELQGKLNFTQTTGQRRNSLDFRKQGYGDWRR